MRLIVVFLSLVLAGCATTAGYEKVLSSWVGANTDRLISVWGAPTNVTSLSNGGQVLEYSRHRSFQVGGITTTTPVTTQHNGIVSGDVNGSYSGTSTTYVPTTTPVQNIAMQCVTRFTANSESIITSWAWQGNDCRALAPDETTPSKNAVATNGKTREENLQTLKGINERNKIACTKPEYAALFEKSPCDAGAITIAQVVDKSKITQEQKEVLLKWRAEMDTITKERNAFFRSAGNAADKRWADYLDSIQPDVDKYNLDFYNEVITLGEYNQIRKDFTAKVLAERRRIYPQ